MKTRNSLLFLAVMLVSLLFSGAAAFADGAKEDFPKLQGWQDPVEYVIGGFPSWASKANNANPDSCGIRISLYSMQKEAPIRIMNRFGGWEYNSSSKQNGLTEVFISDSVLKSFTENKEMSLDSAGLYKSAGLIMYAFPPLYCYTSLDYPKAADGYSVAPVSSLGKYYVLSSYQASQKRKIRRPFRLRP